MEIRKCLTDRLKLECYQILKDVAEDHATTNGGLLPWFQNAIARAEAEDNTARVLSATIVMRAYSDEMMASTFDYNRLQLRVEEGIQKTLGG